MTLSWSIVKNIQIPSTKLQINLKFKYLMTKTFNDGTFFGYSNFDKLVKSQKMPFFVIP